MPERTEAQITADIVAARAAYQDAVDTEPRATVEALSGVVHDLLDELSSVLSEGADPCPTCGTAPHGMLKTEAVKDNPPIYEVGCLTCDNAARGWTIPLTVERWNTGQLIVR